jgi:hypothetical protein
VPSLPPPLTWGLIDNVSSEWSEHAFVSAEEVCNVLMTIVIIDNQLMTLWKAETDQIIHKNNEIHDVEQRE